MATANSESKQKSAKFDRKKSTATSEVTAKIAVSYEKLAAEFRRKSQRASDHIKDAKNEAKRTAYRRKFELYGDASIDLDDRARKLRVGLHHGIN